MFPIDVLITTEVGGKETMVDLLIYEKDMASLLFPPGEKYSCNFTLVLESVELLIFFAVLVCVKFWEGKE